MRQVGTLGTFSKHLVNSGHKTVLSPSRGPITARVLDIILDPSHPKWDAYGRSQGRYGVFYENVMDESDQGFAYCKHSDFKRLPVPGELVTLSTNYAADFSANNSGLQGNKIYWEDIVGVWNQPDVNRYPATDEREPEDAPVFNPIQLCPGDTVIEGRHGQSIRMGGSKYSSSPISKVEDTPYIVIRDGQGNKASQGDAAVFENVNLDSSSVYLTAGQAVPLAESFKPSEATGWPSSSKPAAVPNYSGSQVVVNTDRVILNARNKDIQLISKEGVGLRGQLVGVDGKEAVGINADKIYLGGAIARSENEPAVLGTELTLELHSIYSILEELIEAMSDQHSDDKAWKSNMISTARSLKPVLNKALGKINVENKNIPILSKKTFIE